MGPRAGEKRKQMKVLFILIVCAALVWAGASGGVRCFTRAYTLEPMPNNYTSQTGVPITAFGVAELDLLSATPLSVSFDVVALSAVQRDLCAASARFDALQFMWASDVRWAAPFATLPVPCSASSALRFGLSTLATAVWGSAARQVTGGQLFRPQFGRQGMLSGLYNAALPPQRLRPLIVRMTSERVPVLPLQVTVCLNQAQVPYDMPLDVDEVSPPRLLPLTDCIVQYGGHCSLNLGWANSADETLTLTYGTAVNRLSPPSMENGFVMPSSFGPGYWAPSSFVPRLHVAWDCRLDGETQADWFIDGLGLHLNMFDYICVGPADVLGLSDPMGQPVRQNDISQYTEKPGRHAPTQLQLQLIPPRVVKLEMDEARELWRKAGVDPMHEREG